MAFILTVSKDGTSLDRPLKLHRGVEMVLNEPGLTQVLIHFLAAPINPLDILVLADRYPVKPQHYHNGEVISGYDGVAGILRCGENVTNLKKGDIVIPSKFGIGSWRSHAVVDAEWLMKVPPPDDIRFAAIMRISVAPAYFLVEDMCILKPGDWIIQNAGTSVVSQFVIQFARLRGISTMCVIRDRSKEEAKEVADKLRELGAAEVVMERELEDYTRVLLKPIKLALDSVFGASGTRIMKALATGGTYVQLGFLGGPETLAVDPNDLFGRQLTMKGFRGTSQMALRSVTEQSDLFAWFVSMFNDKCGLRMPVLGVEEVHCDVVDTEAERRLQLAVRKAQNATLGQRKQIIMFT